jgi:hypothetical protein
MTNHQRLPRTRDRARAAAVELSAAIESRDPIRIRHAEREYTLALLDLACERS